MLYRAVAKSEFSGQSPDELTFTTGAIVDVVSDLLDGWAWSLNPVTGASGKAPLELLERITSYDALELYWAGMQTFPCSNSFEQPDKPLPATYVRQDGRVAKIVPVLGFIMFDFCGSLPRELSVFKYDIVQVIGDISAGTIVVRLHIPGEMKVREGMIPRSILEIQQTTRSKCLRNRITVETDEK
ncbi:Protein scd2/ral3 [Paramicrosporidium saccamoebae]|uniref:Protein scd2/ral3 n=1 Tax=Paramicrosporidium saccamoebae TaxID=1246581 RepID=A0A2H9TLE0_9FUNG|nr:Protein scd2/ral3 [Paramicrosporidium saccamoebae]